MMSKAQASWLNLPWPPEIVRESKFFVASDLDGKPIPSREWLVADLVPMNTVTLLGGDGGTGKSLLALQLATAVATDAAWLGKFAESGKALVISAEDDKDELHRRMADIVRANGIALADLKNLHMRSLAGEDALLATLGADGRLTASALYREVCKAVAEVRPKLIILDTLADLFPGNENDRTQARQFISLMRKLAITSHCAVVLLAHPSLSGISSGSGTSGSAGWNNSVRSRLYLERVKDDGYEADPDARTLSTKKANYGRVGGEVHMRWKAGVFVADAALNGLDKVAHNAKAERVFLKLLRLFTDQGRHVNHSGGATYAPTNFATHPQSEGCTKRALRTAMETLLDAGKIKITEHGPKYKRRSFLTLAEGAE